METGCLMRILRIQSKTSPLDYTKWIGISLTKQSFARGVSKLVPVVGGLVSGGLTYATFRPQAKKLMGSLKGTMMMAYENKKVTEGEQVASEV